MLSEKELKKFIVDGYHIINPNLLKDSNIHDVIYNKVKNIIDKEGNPGNNVSPKVPEMEEILLDPIVDKSIESILGKDYSWHIHRYPHISEKTQKWHMDTFWGNLKEKDIEPRWLLVLYYPQKTTLYNGPTELLLGSQHLDIGYEIEYEKASNAILYDTNDNFGIKKKLVIDKGSVVLVDYRIFHRGTSPTDPRHPRFMMKYQCFRTTEPTVNINFKEFDLINTETESWKEHYTTRYTYIWDYLNGQVKNTSGNLQNNINQVYRYMLILKNKESTLRNKKYKSGMFIRKSIQQQDNFQEAYFCISNIEEISRILLRETTVYNEAIICLIDALTQFTNETSLEIEHFTSQIILINLINLEKHCPYYHDFLLKHVVLFNTIYETSKDRYILKWVTILQEKLKKSTKSNNDIILREICPITTIKSPF